MMEGGGVPTVGPRSLFKPFHVERSLLLSDVPARRKKTQCLLEKRAVRECCAVLPS